MKHKWFYQNRVVLRLMCCYLGVIAVISGIACYSGYERRQGELLSDLDMTLVQAASEYENLTDDFWNIYIPLFGEKSTAKSTLQNYYTLHPDKELSPLEKVDLTEVLRQMAARDDQVRWIAVFSDRREYNYIYFPGQYTLQPLGEDFPYLENLKNKKEVLEIYGEKKVNSPGENYDCIAMAGGLPVGWGQGTLAVGFSVDALQQICRAESVFSTLQFDITVEGKCIYTTGEAPYIPEDALEKGSSGLQIDSAGVRRYVQVASQTTRWARVYYSLSWRELFRLSNDSTGTLVGGVAIIVLITFLLYGLLLRMLKREINIIQTGLARIGENHLDTRIQGNFQQSGFDEIAEAINAMAYSLKENIDRAYYYELKQKEAELQELQAKFNPHFLYNSLEMFCARCYQNGDDETAELIAQTASIFRGFIGCRTFIPIREELAFSKRYLALFRARYGQRVRISYDFDNEVLDFGIIRNALQPLIENYFVHGIDVGREDNYICFHGHAGDEETIVITVEDNGMGISGEEMEELNARLREPIATEKESYGLKNLHQRLRLFYGEGCGLTLCRNDSGGVKIRMIIKKMECPQDEQNTQ